MMYDERTDCIFHKKDKCLALDSTYCRIEEKCSFYKDKEKYRFNNTRDRYVERRYKGE